MLPYTVSDGIAWKNTDFKLTEAHPAVTYEGKRLLPLLYLTFEDIGDERVAMTVVGAEKSPEGHIIADIAVCGVRAEYYHGSYYLIATKQELKSLDSSVFDGMLLDIASKSEYDKNASEHVPTACLQLTGGGDGKDPSVVISNPLFKLRGRRIISSSDGEYPQTSAVERYGMKIGEEVAAVIDLSPSSELTMLLTLRQSNGKLLPDPEAVAKEICEKNRAISNVCVINGYLYAELTVNELRTLELDAKDSYLFNLACAYRLDRQRIMLERDGVIWASEKRYGCPLESFPDNIPMHNGLRIDHYLYSVLDYDTADSEKIVIRASKGKNGSESVSQDLFENMGIDTVMKDGVLYLIATESDFDKVGSDTAPGYSFTLAHYVADLIK